MFGMGTGVAFPIWSPGKYRGGPVKTRRGEFCCWANGSIPLVLAYYSHYPRAFVTRAIDHDADHEMALILNTTHYLPLTLPSDNYTGER